MTQKTTGTNTVGKQSAKKPVGITFLNDLVKETKARTRYHLDEEKENFFEYNKTFAKDVRDELIAELVESSIYCKENNFKYLRNNIEIKQYAHFLMIKHFSSFGKMLEGKDFSYHIQIMKNMYKVGLFELFFNDVFDMDEVQAVIDHMYTIDSLINNYVKTVQAQKDFIEENVVNSEVKERALKTLEN